MRHATSATLDGIEDVLAAVRVHPVARERTRGVFHVRGCAFLHFHEDPAGVFADLRSRPGGAWERIEVTRAAGRRDLLLRVARAVADATTRTAPRRRAAGARTRSATSRPGPR